MNPPVASAQPKPRVEVKIPDGTSARAVLAALRERGTFHVSAGLTQGRLLIQVWKDDAKVLKGLLPKARQQAVKVDADAARWHLTEDNRFLAARAAAQTLPSTAS